MLDRTTLLRGLATVLTILTLASCVGPSVSYSGRASPHSTPLVIDEENLNWWDMEAELDGASNFRLIANPMDTGRRVFPSVTVRGVALTPVIELLGHRSVRWTAGSSERTTNLIVGRGGVPQDPVWRILRALCRSSRVQRNKDPPMMVELPRG